MADNQDPRAENFKQAEEAFSHLELDQKAKFLAQEAVTTAFEAVEAVMGFVAEECENLFADPPAASETSSEKEPQAE